VLPGLPDYDLRPAAERDDGDESGGEALPRPEEPQVVEGGGGADDPDREPVAMAPAPEVEARPGGEVDRQRPSLPGPQRAEVLVRGVAEDRAAEEEAAEVGPQLRRQGDLRGDVLREAAAYVSDPQRAAAVLAGEHPGRAVQERAEVGTDETVPDPHRVRAAARRAEGGRALVAGSQRVAAVLQVRDVAAAVGDPIRSVLDQREEAATARSVGDVDLAGWPDGSAGGCDGHLDIERRPGKGCSLRRAADRGCRAGGGSSGECRAGGQQDSPGQASEQHRPRGHACRATAGEIKEFVHT